MNKPLRWMAYGLCAALILAVAIGRPKAQDAVKAAPDIYRVLLENEHVRLLEIRMQPGDCSPERSHPMHLIYALSDSQVRFMLPNEEDKVVTMRVGETAWSGPETHSVENIGATEAHVLVVEMKDSSMSPSDPQLALKSEQREHVMHMAGNLEWRNAPDSLPAGAKMAVLSGDPQKPGPFTLRFKIPAGYRVAPHSHPADEHVTVVSGSIFMGMGNDQYDETCGTQLTPGGFAMMPARQHHFAWTEEPAVIQIHGIGPWGITYVNPDDDPRAKTDTESYPATDSKD